MDNQIILQDLLAFIFIAKEDKILTDSQILVNVCHDLSGIIRKEKCFVPRTDGHHKQFLSRQMKARLHKV